MLSYSDERVFTIHEHTNSSSWLAYYLFSMADRSLSQAQQRCATSIHCRESDVVLNKIITISRCISNMFHSTFNNVIANGSQYEFEKSLFQHPVQLPWRACGGIGRGEMLRVHCRIGGTESSEVSGFPEFLTCRQGDSHYDGCNHLQQQY